MGSEQTEKAHILTDEDRAFIASKSPANDETQGWEYALLHRAVEMVVREHIAKALDAAASDRSLRLSGHSGVSISRLRERAASLRTPPS